MNIHLRYLLLSITCTLLAVATAQAEVYKWVDENGKVRFSDKAPQDKPAEAIGEQVEQTNIDTDSSQAVHHSSSTGKTEDERRLEQKQKEKLQEHVGPACQKIKYNIDLIASGARVAFHDDNGKEIHVPEKDRGAKLAEWQEAYERVGCSKLDT